MSRLLLSEGGSCGLLRGKQLSVGAVCGINEGVEALTVGAGGNTRGIGDGLLLGLGAGLLPELLGLGSELLRLGLELLSGGGLGLLLRLGSELGSVNIVLEVAMSRVSGVNEWVKVSSWLLLLLHWSRSELLLLLLLRLELLLGHWSGLLLSRSGGSGLLRQVLTSGLSNSRVKGGTLEASGSLRDVRALEDPEAILASAVPHGDGLAVLIDVAVLTNPLAI